MSDLKNVDKEPKKRKGFYKYIQNSIEFFLSDANLRSDSYMRSVLSVSKEIDPRVFLTFNRIQRIKAEVTDILKAVTPSKVLEVTPEGKIRRRFPVVEKSKEDVDWCSIYVEKLPLDTTPDDLIKTFSAFGKVAKVTIPKSYINSKIAGFAFVEFEDFHSRLRAVQAFRTYGAIVNNNQPAEIDGELDDDRRQENDQVQKLENAKLENDAVDALLPGISDCNEPKSKKNRKKKPKGKLRFMGVEIMSKTAWNMLRNRYLTLQAFNRRRMKIQLSKQKKSPVHRSRLKAIIPGSIVRVSLPKKAADDSDVKALRAELKQIENVEYVDLEPQKMQCYLRMNSAEAANALVISTCIPGAQMEIVTSSEEAEYMRRIEEDRQSKFAGSRKNTSGKNKILAKAERQLAFKVRSIGDDSLHI